MYKAMAILRTLFLLFIVVYTALNTPAEMAGDSVVSVTFDSLRRVRNAAWLAIAWIAFETVVSWAVIRFRRPAIPKAAPPHTTGEPPPPPPVVRG